MAVQLEDRPTMYQTMTPFVECYIGGYDVLRSPSGKPRRLISFQHNIRGYGGSGFWELELFDDDHTAIEELILDLNRGTGEFEGEQISNPALFRYGYISQDGKVLSLPGNGGEFFTGSISSIRPTYQVNGASYVITGQTVMTGVPYKKERRVFYNTDLYSIVKRVCDFMDWELKPLMNPEKEELGPEELPIVLLDAQQSMDTTEEQPKTFIMEEDETPIAFIKRLCGQALPVDGNKVTFDCRLEYRSETTESENGGRDGVNPKGYLYFGPVDFLQKPRRKYVYMRDPNSDIVSFSPSVMLDVAIGTGAAGMVVKSEDILRGEMAAHPYTEVDRMVKYFGNRRTRMGRETPGDGTTQEGSAEQEPQIPRYEGGSTGPAVIAPPVKLDEDSPQIERTSPTTNRFFSDQQQFSQWLDAKRFCYASTLEVVGDPTIQWCSNIAIFMFMPRENKKFSLHWISGIWCVNAISHNIAGGTYTTTMQLIRNAHLQTEAGKSVETNAQYNDLIDTLDEDALKHLED